LVGIFLGREVTPSEKVDPVKGAAEHNKEYAKPRREVRLRLHKWTRRALSLTTATAGDHEEQSVVKEGLWQGNRRYPQAYSPLAAAKPHRNLYHLQGEVGQIFKVQVFLVAMARSQWSHSIKQLLHHWDVCI